MQPLIRNFGIVVSLLTLFTLNKTHDDTPVSNLRISRVVDHVASQPANKSTVIDFKYDDQQRLEKFVFSTGDQSTGTLMVTPADSFQYYYNGTVKNPYKASYTTSAYIGLGIQETYFRFNNAGQVIYDSATFTMNPSYATREYTYATDKILTKNISFYTGSAPGTLTDTFLIKDNNLTEVHYGNPSSAYTTIRCYVCTYDNKINPIHELNFATVEPVEGLAGFPSYLAPGISKNNIVGYSFGSINYQGKFIVDQTVTLSYTYNSDGLPETCIMKTNQDTHTVNYYYEAKP